MNRLVIAYSTAGTGHRRAAEAIAEAVRGIRPGTQIACVDFLAYTPGWYRWLYPQTYMLLIRHLSWFWGAGYLLLDWVPVLLVLQPLRRLWNLLIARRAVRWLREWQPDVLVATHFFPADVFGAGKRAGWLRARLAVVVTDFYPHQLWLVREADRFIAGARETAGVLERRGVAAGRVAVLGIPVAAAHGQTRDRRASREHLGLHPDRFTVLLIGGGSTIGIFEPVAEALMALEARWPTRLQLVVVCGTDARMQNRLSRRAGHLSSTGRVLGFIEYLPAVMAATDLLVAKAGGLIVSEALAHGLPMVLYHAIPGQEEANAEYVTRHGAAVLAENPDRVCSTVQRALQDPHVLEPMQQAARALGRVQAAEAVVTQVLGPWLDDGVRSGGSAAKPPR